MRGLTQVGLILLLSTSWLLVPAGPSYAEPLQQGTVIHVVAWGETLFSIARQYGTTVDAIAAANGISSPTHIYAGQRLTIPTSGSSAGVAAPATAAATHVVQPGENLFRIALRYGTTIRALSDLNGIYNPAQIHTGQQLTIPGSATTPSPAYQPAHATSTHVVQAGETLTTIASRYGVSVWTLVQANNIASASLILPGQTLVIPPEGTAAAPAPSGSGKRILIDLSEQHLYAYNGNTLVYSFVASTGINNGTRVGTFRVLDKIPNAYASTWNLQMPHWLGIYWAGSLENGIHALPILSNGQRLWAGYLGTPVSYGCIILGVEEARQLYNWAVVGIPVVIQHSEREIDLLDLIAPLRLNGDDDELCQRRHVLQRQGHGDELDGVPPTKDRRLAQQRRPYCQQVIQLAGESRDEEPARLPPELGRLSRSLAEGTIRLPVHRDPSIDHPEWAALTGR